MKNRTWSYYRALLLLIICQADAIDTRKPRISPTMGQCISSARHYEDAPTPKMVRSTQSTQSQPRKLHVTVSLDSSSDRKVCISFEMEEEQTPVESANKIAPEPSKKYYYNDIHITTVRQICVLYKYHGYETNGLLT